MDLLTRTPLFAPTREAALQRLAVFAPSAGAHYAGKRNFDFGPDDRSNISALSPHIRHRLISEREVCMQVLKHFAPSSAEKFIQEVFWRSYWKGWLEMRPALWQRYYFELEDCLKQLDHNAGLRKAYEKAVEGRTGNEAFDAWAAELVETGYLHNHTRMWFASIWIFTLRLPWQLGADFFYRHLMDGDPASNTLSWRWVAGLHTRGKTYLARAANITEYTQGRFGPQALSGLAREAEPLEWDNPPSSQPLTYRAAPQKGSSAPSLLVVTEEDCNPMMPENAVGFVTWQLTQSRSPLPVGRKAIDFAGGALADARARLLQTLPDLGAFSGRDAAPDIVAIARQAAAADIVIMHVPVGPVADAMAALEQLAKNAGKTGGLAVRAFVSEWDRLAWPHASRGFFNLKAHIPELLRLNGLV
jgi:deoxyribodipyrimidine photo-lyase